MAGYKAFNERFVSSDQNNLSNYSDFDARKMRNSMLWAMYENTAYDSIHTWAESLKTKKGLYKHIRNIYNPSYRIGEFWKAKLYGGVLDPAAGDGVATPSCLPIVTNSTELRKAIAQVWAWSNWQVNKDIFALRTSILGDGILQVMDSPIKEKVYIRSVHPSRLKDIDLDEFGNVKGYIFEWKAPDPRNQTGDVTYREVCTRDGDTIVYQTYLNEGLYAWDGNPVGEDGELKAEWTEDYGFVPMVFLKHNDVGLDYGWSELYPSLSKFREVDDQASKLHDQIRKLVEGAWLLAGVTDPATTKKATGQAATDEKPQPGRTEQKIFYTNNAEAKPHSLVADIKVDQVSANIKDIIAEIERDYPELRVDLTNITGDISGRALRINRGPASAKVLQRRPNYDNALVRAQQMAVAIGGMRGYDNFSGFNLDSFNAGGLDHSIGYRPVFENDPMDNLEEDKLFWENAGLAKKAGVSLPVYLKRQGWPQKEINEVIKSDEYRLSLEASRLAVDGLKAASLANTEGSGTSDNQDDNADDQNV